MSICEEISKVFGDKANCYVDKFGEAWVEISIESLKEVLGYLAKNGFDHLSTITGYDTGEKIMLVYHLVKFTDGRAVNVNVRTFVDRDNPIAPSVIDLYPSALVYEREVYDLLGVKFDGHPRLKRLLLPEDVPEDFHPLRKDAKFE